MSESEELNERYPEGTLERKVLDYSRSESLEEELPPMLLGAFRLLMGVSILVAVVTIAAYLSH